MNTNWRLQIAIRLVDTYTDLVTYWSQPIRMIASWQTKEFITNQLKDCELELTKHTTWLKELTLEDNN